MRGVCDTVRLLRDEQRISQPELARALTPEDLALLDDEIADAAWYAIGSYDRLLTLLLHREGADRPEYLHERGKAVVERLRDQGLYLQLDALAHAHLRVGEESLAELLGRLRRVMTFAALAFDFLETEADPWPDQPGIFRLRFRNAAALPDVAIPIIEGFIEACVDLLTGRVASIPPPRGQRTSPDVVDFELDLQSLLRA